ncbi:MAG: hypothetical protein K5780_03280 [Alphaproteobacteria bacterium]|nr:hypothetical protein [Alphaproteobacteria bacterium]
MGKIVKNSSEKNILNDIDPNDIYSEENLSDESLSDCLEFLIRTTPTTMPEWMN